jgi:hypothetical protein
MPRGEDLGLPTAEEAYQQAVGNRTTKHGAVIYALRRLDSFALRQAREAEARRMFAAAWEAAITHRLAGGEFPDPVAELDHKRPVKAEPSTAEPHLSALKGMFADV